MNIKKMLENYRENLSTLEILTIERDKLLSSSFMPDVVKYIKSPVYSFTMISETNKFKSIVESAFLQLEKVEDKIKTKIQAIDRKRLKLAYEISITEGLLKALDDTEKFVIESFYFKNIQMSKIHVLYVEKFGSITERWLWQKKDDAIKKMCNIFSYGKKFRCSSGVVQVTV